MGLMLQVIRSAAALLMIALAACGGGGGDEAAPPSASAMIGAAGGTVSGPNGASVVIPPGALAADTTIAIEETSAGSPPLPGGFSAAGRMFAFTPHGTTFALPVTVTLPFDPASVPAGRTPALYKTTAANQWVQVPNAGFGSNSVTAQITSFSWVQVNGLLRSDPTRVWSFDAILGNGAQVSLGGATQVGGLLEEVVDFGPGLGDIDIITSTQTIPADGKARGYVFGTPDGVTYGAYVEAPYAKLGGTEPIGGVARLEQTQSFIKLSPDATLSFTLTSALISASDAGSRGAADELISGRVIVDVVAYTANRSFFRATGIANLNGSAARWVPEVLNLDVSMTPLWSEADFQFDTFQVAASIFAPCTFIRADLYLKKPRRYTVDLSSIAVGQEFTLQSLADAAALNRRGGGPAGDCEGSAALAFLRDPLEIGGTTIDFTGLQPTNNPVLVRPVEPPVVPAACVPGPGPDPAAGTLQFSAASYAISEFAGATPTVRVTRSGGSRGAVTATFTTSDGTALAGADYTAVRVSVFFADGDASRRAVVVPIVADQIVESNKTVNLTLSQPGGCATLGPQTTAVLTIVDDDKPPPPPRISLPTGIDTSFGIAGKATLERFGGDRSGMALQADGKIVMVGGTFTDFILARFNADGSIDRGFGVDGKVTTDMGSGLRGEEALAVAIQSDGKIVVVGYAAIDARPPAPNLPATFAIARYNRDGSLDTSFGTGGRVSGNVNGLARAVAIQPDGKIVLAGDFEIELSNGTFASDIVVARFNANGSLDLPFGTSGTGQVATDIGGAANSGRNVVLQPNGAIVVSGTPQCSQPGCIHTDVVRYNANGTLDTSFGSGGKLTLADVDVGQGLVQQADGKLVLVGTVVQATAPATSRHVLMRRLADGSADTGFGTGGTAGTTLSENASANGVALQADGKLVVVGTRAFSPNANFIVARYHGDGSLDTGFANAGALSIDFFGFTDIGENVLVQPDGRILVGGLARNQVDGYGVARINP